MPAGLIGVDATQGGACLDDPQGDTADGTQLQIYGCNGLWTQQWNVAV